MRWVKREMLEFYRSVGGSGVFALEWRFSESRIEMVDEGVQMKSVTLGDIDGLGLREARVGLLHPVYATDNQDIDIVTSLPGTTAPICGATASNHLNGGDNPGSWAIRPKNIKQDKLSS
ncbi:hypothetical protein AB5N19_02881 [Seiridium cardinale]|uniref:Uncharacterized protein n=1 Tax=Seiridium cardinale TaxID=138064 RepID=A0ABR2XCQ7_9PEZI